MYAETNMSSENLTRIGIKITQETSSDLEALINKKIDSKLETVAITEIKNLDTSFEIESHAIEIYLRIIRDINGTIAFIFPREDAFDLATLLLEEHGCNSNEFSKMELSALKEVCNIFAGSFVNNLAGILKNNPILSVPSLVFTTPKTLTKLILTGIDKENQKALLLKINFTIDSKLIECNVILMLEQEPLDALLNIA